MEATVPKMHVFNLRIIRLAISHSNVRPFQGQSVRTSKEISGLWTISLTSYIWKNTYCWNCRILSTDSFANWVLSRTAPLESGGRCKACAHPLGAQTLHSLERSSKSHRSHLHGEYCGQWEENCRSQSHCCHKKHLEKYNEVRWSYGCVSPQRWVVREESGVQLYRKLWVPRCL